MKYYLFLLTLSLAAFGQEETKGSDVKYIAPKSINFDDVLVQGKLEKPEMAIITANEDDDLSSLLRLRENFDDVMERSFEDRKEKTK